MASTVATQRQLTSAPGAPYLRSDASPARSLENPNVKRLEVHHTVEAFLAVAAAEA